MSEESSAKKILDSVRAETAASFAKAKKVAGPKERGEALKVKLGKPQLAKAKPDMTVKAKSGVEGGIIAPAPKTRSLAVIEFGKRAKVIEKPMTEQTHYERRGYMRNFHLEEINENTVTHLTSHNLKMIFDAALPKMQEMYNQRTPSQAERDIFRTRDLIDALGTWGPAYGDINRAVMRKYAKLGYIEIIEVPNGPKRHTFKYKLLQLTPVETQKEAQPIA